MPTPVWRRYLRFLRPDVDADVDDELRFHFDERIGELIRAGAPPAEARRRAVEEFGDVDQVRAGLRDIDRRILENRARDEWWHSLAGESRRALRRLVRQPGFAVPAGLTLALGIGATTTVFALLDAVVLSPLPFAHADRLVTVTSPVPAVAADAEWGIGRHEMLYIEEHARTIETIGVFRAGPVTVMGDAGRAAERARSAIVSASLFDVLGLAPYRGRLFTPQDNLHDPPNVVILGHAYWTRRFGADPRIVGRTIAIEGRSLEVVGIVPPGASLPDLSVDLWVPQHIDPAMPARNNHVYNGVARLARGFTAADAQRELVAFVRRYRELFPTAYSQRFLESGFSKRVAPLRDEVVGPVITRALWILFGAVGIVLVVAAANVANLFLVRAEARRREVAVRTALGAGRGQLAGHFLAEGLVLALAAAALGIGLGWAALRAIVAVAPAGLPRLSEVQLGWATGAVAVAGAVVAGIVFGLFPLAHAGAGVATLREGGRGLTHSRRRNAVRGALVVGQVALALVLLAGAGLMLQSFRNLRGVHPGFDPTGVLTMEVSLPTARYDDEARVASFFQEASDRIRALPGVSGVGFGQSIPLDGNDGCTGVVSRAPTSEERRSDCVMTMQVTPGYFHALGMRLQGRAPEWAETNARVGGVVVTRALAEQFWPGQNPMGQGLRCCQAGPAYYAVTGVADDVRSRGLDAPAPAAVFFPMRTIEGAPLEGLPRSMRLVVRARDGNLDALTLGVRRVLGALDDQVPVASIEPMETLVDRSMAKRSFTLLLLAVASGMALLLSGVGLYGVVSYVVSQRRGEIGIRMALGARSGAVGRMVVGQSVRLAVLGVLVGVAVALAATRALGSLLFGVAPTDAATLGGAAAFLVALSAAASYGPARRAMRVDPVEALKGE